jgi:hypothetical protein
LRERSQALFGTLIPGFEEAALEVIAAGLEKGAQPRDIKRAARLRQEYELQFWNTVAEAPQAVAAKAHPAGLVCPATLDLGSAPPRWILMADHAYPSRS